MPNAWLTHLVKIKKTNPGKSLKQCIILGKKSYKKGRKKVGKKGSVNVGGSVNIGGSVNVGGG